MANSVYHRAEAQRPKTFQINPESIATFDAQIFLDEARKHSLQHINKALYHLLQYTKKVCKRLSIYDAFQYLFVAKSFNTVRAV